MEQPKKARYWLIHEAVKTLGGAVTYGQIYSWVKEHYGIGLDGRNDLSRITVNDGSRGHNSATRTNMRSDSNHPHDLLYKNKFLRSGDRTPSTGNGERNGAVTYELYNVGRHGIWELYPNHKGKPRLIVPGSEVSAMDAALASAHDDEEQQIPPLDSDHDARKWVMAAVARRQGQSRFREALLTAYDFRCAITECSAIDVLEAAHIKPYRGKQSNRTDNGLLLRADVHTLFDLRRIWIDDKMTVQIADSLRGTEYEEYAGKRLRLPEAKADHPKHEHLDAHRPVIAVNGG